jgi:hypothetical protein
MGAGTYTFFFGKNDLKYAFFCLESLPAPEVWWR